MTARKKVQRKKVQRKKAQRGKARRKPAQRKKASRKKARPPKRSARPPVVTLPRKYDAYFRKHFANAPADSPLQLFCCGSADGIPTDDAQIGPAFGALTEQLSAAKDSGFEATRAEVAAIRTWPPDQLRAFRLALIDILGQRGCGRPVKRARFQGRQRDTQKRLVVDRGERDMIITFVGP